MMPDLTPAVSRALEAAQGFAHQEDARELEPWHVLLALLEEEEGLAASLLRRAGLDLAALRDWRARPQTEPGSSTPRPQGERIRDALRLARERAVDASIEGTIGSDHLVPALIASCDRVRGQLEALGLVLAEVDRLTTPPEAAPLAVDEPLSLDETTERMNLARILDATANRAREALRVIEDYCRFVLNDATLSRELKELRHDLTAALETWAPPFRLIARDTPGDVGTRFSTPGELNRQSLRQVALVNSKRLQEALRSLEEYGKVERSELGQAIEALRYRAYTVERAMSLGATVTERLAHAQLYVLLTGSRCLAALDWTIQEAAAGGAEVFQLREKELTDRELLERARSVRRWTRAAGVLFIMNDRPDIARLVEADGVHVGQDELPVAEVRRIVGPELLIGVSTHDLDQVRRAVLDGASYLGVGPTFPSATKEFGSFPGLEFVQAATAATSLPTFAIGGIRMENIHQVVAAGGRRVAVSDAICRADDPQLVAAALRRGLPPLA